MSQQAVSRTGQPLASPKDRRALASPPNTDSPGPLKAHHNGDPVHRANPGSISHGKTREELFDEK